MADNQEIQHSNPHYPPFQVPCGRPSEYKPEYPEMLLKYFQDRPLTKFLKKTYTTKAGTVIEEDIEKANHLPTLEGFCESIGIVKQTLYNWIKEHPPLMDSYLRAKQIFRDFLIQNAICGRYDSKFSMFVAINDTDMRDSKDINVNVHPIDNLSDAELETRIRQEIERLGLTPKQLEHIIDVTPQDVVDSNACEQGKPVCDQIENKQAVNIVRDK
jgi:hypothetical protein